MATVPGDPCGVSPLGRSCSLLHSPAQQPLTTRAALAIDVVIEGRLLDHIGVGAPDRRFNSLTLLGCPLVKGGRFWAAFNVPEPRFVPEIMLGSFIKTAIATIK